MEELEITVKCQEEVKYDDKDKMQYLEITFDRSL